MDQLITTADGSQSLMSVRYGQSFHSADGARKEAEDLYIAGSYFKDFFSLRKSANVLDVGLGLAYNAVATIKAAWECAQQNSTAVFTLQLYSLEHDVDLITKIVTNNAPWIQNWSPMERSWLVGFDGQLSQIQTRENLTIQWSILAGDAASSRLSSIPTCDFIWQDPFSPEVNPELWSATWFAELLQLASPTTQLMTYSVSRKVKDALSEAGWTWERIPTTTQKRAWLRANPCS